MSAPDVGVGLMAGGASPFDPNGLVLDEGLTFEQWAHVGSTLATIERGVSWWLGDWVRYGEAAYGEKYAQAVLETGREKQTLQNLAWVAGRFEISRRRENLPWSHHEEVAALPVEEQERLLDRAEREGWSRARLREAKQTLRLAVPSPAPTLPGAHSRAPEAEPGPEESGAPPGFVPVAELEHADAELRQKDAVIASLQQDDKDRTIVTLHTQLQQMRGVDQRKSTTLYEAQGEAKRRGELLARIRAALGVERDRDILPAIEARKGV